MRLAPALGFALHAAAAASLAVALLDFLAYEFAFVDLVSEPRAAEVSRWSGPTGSSPARSLLVLLLFTGAAAFGAFGLARVRRVAGPLLALAATCTLGQVIIAVAAAHVWRAEQLAEVIAVDPRTSQTWLDRYALWSYGPALVVQSLVGALASISIVATVLAGVRVALHRGWSPARAWLTGALALPPLLATGALATLWDRHGNFRPPGWRHEDWVQLVQSARWAIVGAALLVAAAAALLLRKQPRARLLPAALLCALGLAAVVVTAPHRAAIDGLYPLPRFGARPTWPAKLPAPWDFDARVAGGCLDSPNTDERVVVRVRPTGELAATVNTFPISLTDPPADVRDEFDRLLNGRGFITLYADRRVPVAALMPLFEKLPNTELNRVIVAGIAAAEMLSAEGPVIVWRRCAIGSLQLPTFLRARLAPNATWGDVLDDPALVWRPEAR